MYSVCIHMVKVVSYYDLSVLSMSVMGFKKKFGWGGCGAYMVWGQLHPVLFWIFFN